MCDTECVRKHKWKDSTQNDCSSYSSYTLASKEENAIEWCLAECTNLRHQCQLASITLGITTRNFKEVSSIVPLFEHWSVVSFRKGLFMANRPYWHRMSSCCCLWFSVFDKALSRESRYCMGTALFLINKRTFAVPRRHRDPWSCTWSPLSSHDFEMKVSLPSTIAA